MLFYFIPNLENEFFLIAPTDPTRVVRAHVTSGRVKGLAGLHQAGWDTRWLYVHSSHDGRSKSSPLDTTDTIGRRRKKKEKKKRTFLLLLLLFFCCCFF